MNFTDITVGDLIRVLTFLIPIVLIIIRIFIWIDKEFDEINQKIVQLEKDLIIVKTSIIYLEKISFKKDESNDSRIK